MMRGGSGYHLIKPDELERRPSNLIKILRGGGEFLSVSRRARWRRENALTHRRDERSFRQVSNQKRTCKPTLMLWTL